MSEKTHPVLTISTLVLPKATNSTPALGKFDARLTGLPHSSMTAITLSSSLMSTKERHESPTPVHLRQNLSPPVDFTSHVPPPTKVGNSQLLVQVYAAAVDVSDITALEDKVTADVGKWIPGRSFVGRALVVGQDEESIHRGDIVIGLSDIKKSGALCEYILIDRRRVARIDPTHLTLEQMALLPSQGITALRAISGVVAKGARALVMDADRGVAALIAQAMARQGVHVTAVVAEGTEEEEKEAEARAHAHGASSVLVGTPTSALATLAASSLHVVVDTHGGSRVADAARRALVEGGHVLALCGTKAIQPPNGLRAAFSRRRTAVTVTPIAPAGTGEPAVDIAGLDCRDVLEEPALADLRPVVDPARVVPFERGADVFVRGGVVRIIN